MAEQHPESVALVFEAFNIRAEVNERNLSNAITIFRKPFVAALGDSIGSELEWSNNVGDDKRRNKRNNRSNRRNKREAPIGPAQMMGVKRDAITSLNDTISQANANVVKKDISQTTTAAPTQKQGFDWNKAAGIPGDILGLASGRKRVGYYDEGGLATERVFGISRPLFITLAVLVVLAIAVTIYRKK